MNGSHDDPSFEEYLQRGTAVSQQYRALGEDSVPKELDERVLSRATQAIGDRPGSKARAWRRWTVPVTLAASVILVFSIVLESGVHHEAVTMRSPTPSATEDPPGVQRETEVAPAAPRPSSSSSQKAANQPVAGRVTAQEDRNAEQPPAPAAAEQPRDLGVQSARRRPGADADRPPGESQSAERREQQFAATPPATRDESQASVPLRATSVRRVEPPAPSFAADAETSGALSSESVARASGGSEVDAEALASEQADIDVREWDAPEWLERIRQLRQIGQGDAADREWEAFRRAFPRYAVAEGDRARPDR